MPLVQSLAYLLIRLLFGPRLTISTLLANDARSVNDIFNMLMHRNHSIRTNVNCEKVSDQRIVEAPPKKVTDLSWMFENANEDRIVLSLTSNNIQTSTNEVTIKRGYKVLASYSWKQTDASTIYVPDTPPAFSACGFAAQDPPANPIQLQPDSGSH
jgi:hypothetical protein